LDVSQIPIPSRCWCATILDFLQLRLNFSRSNSEMELIARRIIQEKEGEEGKKHIAEYADAKTERGKCLLRTICEEMGFDSLGYQSLDGILEAIGLDRDKICTYCWTGEE